MKTRSLTGLVLILAIAACNHSKKDRIVGTWRGTKLENTRIDSFFIKSQQLIDTLGKYNDPDRNYELYGTSNMDSVRRALQGQRDSALTVQNAKVTKTVFIFASDKNAYITFDDHLTTDTAHWNFDDEGALLLEDISTGGGHAVKKLTVLQLTDSVFQVQIWSNDDSSKITFQKVAN